MADPVPETNFTPPPGTPGYLIPLGTEPGTSLGAGPSIDYTYTRTVPAPPKEPAQKGSKKPDALDRAQPLIDESGAPISGAAAPEDALSRAQPLVNETGQPIRYDQEFRSAESPGALAVGRTIAEDRVPGPWFQAKINVSTDPAQRMRIVADQLFPNDPNGLNKIIVGPGGRLAAVDERGPYYVEPAPVFADTSGYTKGAPGGWPWSPPGTAWEPTGAAQFSPYSRAAPLAPGALSPSNVASAAGAAAPGAIALPFSFSGAAAPGPWSIPAVAATTAATEGGRRAIANWLLDPAAQAERPNILSQEVGEDAIKNALLQAGFRLGGAMFRGVTPGPAGTAPPPAGPGGGIADPEGYIGSYGRRMPVEEHPLAGQTQWPGQPPQAIGPSEPITARPAEGTVEPAALPRPGEAAAPTVNLNPAGEAAAASGPYAPSTAEEVRAIPNAMPPARGPVLTRAQAERRADEIIRWWAGRGPTEADTRDLIPGSPGTLAQRTGNAGLATLERAVRNVPEATNHFAAVDTAQQGARRELAARLIGTPDDITAMETARDEATSAARTAAFANKAPTDASSAVAEIDKVLQGPEGKRPGVAEPLRLLRRQFFDVNPETGEATLETDPEMLYGVRKAITDALSPMARGTERYAQAAAAQLQPVIKALDAAIEKGAPGFRDYLAQFNEQSRPIDAMRYLQSRNITDATTGTPTLQKVDSLIKEIERQRAQSGVRPADALDASHIETLYALRDDLRRAANLGKGKALGSNTVQNLAGGNFLINALTRPVSQEIGKMTGVALGGPIGYAAMSGAENALAGFQAQRQQWVLDALIRRLLNENNVGVRALRGGP